MALKKSFSSIREEEEIPWVRHWIEKMVKFTEENFVDPKTGEVDFFELGKEEYDFRMALQSKKFSLNERAEYLYKEALKKHNDQYGNGIKGGRPKKNGSAKPVTDAPTREDGENNDNGGSTSASVNLESANIRDENTEVTTNDRDDAGDATTRKDVEESPMRGCVAISSQQLNSGTSTAPSTLADLANNVKNVEPKKMAFGIAKVIMLTAEEALEIKDLYKEDLPIAAQIIENYLVNNAKKASKYKSHYMVMRKGGWVWQRVQEYKAQLARTATAEKNLENAKNRANYKPFEVRQREMIQGVAATLEDPPEHLIKFKAG